jgi:malic enzyme
MFGAGQAGAGAAAAVVAELTDRGLTPAAAAARVWLIDTKGLVYDGRPGPPPAPWKAPFARRDGVATLGGVDPAAPLADVVAALRPTALIGSAAVGGAFTEGVLTALDAGVRATHGAGARPVVLALSNPTAAAECTAAAAAAATGGRAVFASGTKFAGAAASQVNNAYLFPGIGLGLAAADARASTAGPLLPAARALAALVTPADTAAGAVLPPLTALPAVTRAVAAAVAADVVGRGEGGRGAVAGLDRGRAAAERAVGVVQYDPWREKGGW